MWQFLCLAEYEKCVWKIIVSAYGWWKSITIKLWRRTMNIPSKRKVSTDNVQFPSQPTFSFYDVLPCHVYTLWHSSAVTGQRKRKPNQTPVYNPPVHTSSLLSRNEMVANLKCRIKPMLIFWLSLAYRFVWIYASVITFSASEKCQELLWGEVATWTKGLVARNAIQKLRKYFLWIMTTKNFKKRILFL